MPRCARLKGEDKIFHIMVKSIKEVPLFRENKDKDLFLNIVSGYQETYGFKVYGYCLMDNHAHFIIDVNGADISKIMHSINFKYATLYNQKYGRRGHLFQDRFKSKIVDNDRYLITLSAYIHNNPLSMKKYKHCPEKYKYSSLGVYLGLRKDPFGILDEAFVMQLFSEDVDKARLEYIKAVYGCSDKKFMEEIEFIDEVTCYKSERHILVRDFNPYAIMDFMADRMGMYRERMYMKGRKDMTTARAFAALIMRNLCNYRCKDICSILGNITQGRVSKLCSIALSLMDKDESYRNIVREFMEVYA